MKRILIIEILSVTLCFAGLGLYLYIAYNQTKTASSNALKTFDKSTVAGKISIARRMEIEKRIEQENIAKKFYETGDYESAIREYKKAAEMSKYHQWVPRYRLSEVYEKAGHNDLAIQEIDWLLSQKPSRQVIDELNARKERLQSLPKSTAAE